MEDLGDHRSGRVGRGELQRLQLLHFLGDTFNRLCDPLRSNGDQEHFDNDQCDYENRKVAVGLLETADKVVDWQDDGHLPGLSKTGRKSAENGDVILTGCREREGTGPSGSRSATGHTNGRSAASQTR